MFTIFRDCMRKCKRTFYKKKLSQNSSSWCKLCVYSYLILKFSAFLLLTLSKKNIEIKINERGLFSMVQCFVENHTIAIVLCMVAKFIPSYAACGHGFM